MRIAYLDCSTGIAGDMTVAALIDAGVDAAAITAAVDSLALPGVRLNLTKVMRCGFRATHLKVEHPEQHAHRHLKDIHAILERGSLSPRQQDLARRIFHAVAEAEAKVHGTTIDRIHFHEVGAIDSIVDIVAAAVAFDLLGVDRVVSSPVPTGRGKVHIAHGVCAVPTPGTAELLRGIPLVDVPIDAELTTPTGAAILKTVADHFGPLPEMTLEQIGYGAGTKDFPDRANVLRVLVGSASASGRSDRVLVLETNLDDVSPEIIGYTKQKLLAAGALDVFTAPIQMKKDRPGTLLSVICDLFDREKLEAILFSETATFGIRRHVVERSKRTRTECVVETAVGAIRGKLGEFGGQRVFTPEFAACAQVAAARNVPLRDVYRAAEVAFAAGKFEISNLKSEISDPKSPSSEHRHAAPAQDHSHDHGHDSVHDHSHDHAHDHGHDHDHSHGHDHDHHDH